MQLYVLTLKPLSAFGTPLKGDTLFGCFCWQAAQDDALLNGGLDTWIRQYAQQPFAVFSSAYPVFKAEDGSVRYALPRPALPMSWFKEDQDSGCAERLRAYKERKARNWLLAGQDLHIEFSWQRIVDDRHLGSYLGQSQGRDADLRLGVDQAHNTINRLSNTTGKGEFAPYAMHNFWYHPDSRLALFALIDESALDPAALRTGMERMGAFGFGRDASTGLGRFQVEDCQALKPAVPQEANALYCLGPCVPGPDEYDQAWFMPFTRFGRHGSQLLHTGKPFKNPVVMADEGAVFLPKDAAQIQQPYMGRAVTGISKAQPEAVCQGYSIVLPMQLPQ